MIFQDEDFEDQTVVLIDAEDEDEAIEKGFEQMGFDVNDDDDRNQIYEQMEYSGKQVGIKEVEDTEGNVISLSCFDLLNSDDYIVD